WRYRLVFLQQLPDLRCAVLASQATEDGAELAIDGNGVEELTREGGRRSLSTQEPFSTARRCDRAGGVDDDFDLNAHQRAQRPFERRSAGARGGAVRPNGTIEFHRPHRRLDSHLELLEFEAIAALALRGGCDRGDAQANFRFAGFDRGFVWI